jgi:hypothetical protein
MYTPPAGMILGRQVLDLTYLSCPVGRARVGHFLRSLHNQW